MAGIIDYAFAYGIGPSGGGDNTLEECFLWSDTSFNRLFATNNPIEFRVLPANSGGFGGVSTSYTKAGIMVFVETLSSGASFDLVITKNGSDIGGSTLSGINLASAFEHAAPVTVALSSSGDRVGVRIDNISGTTPKAVFTCMLRLFTS